MSDQSVMPSDGQQPVDPSSEATPVSGRKGWIAPVASAAVVAVVAGGGFAVWRFMSDPGVQPAEVLPATTLGLLSVDLAPDGAQQVEAIRALRKFPGIREKAGASSRDDLMKELVEDLLEDSDCTSVDYAKDVQPWIGRSLAVGGVVLGDEKPRPVAAIEVEDAERARAALPEIAACLDEEGETGWTVTEDYVILSDTADHARAIAAAGEESPLSEDPQYQKWTAEAGSAGIAGFYVAKDAPQVLTDVLADSFGDAAGQGAEDPAELLREQWKDFAGAAGTLRFADGGLELSMAGGGVAQGSGKGSVADHVAALPADTTAVLALAPDTEALGDVTDGALGSLFGPGAGLQELAAETGITLPDDLQTLLGEAFSLSLGGDAPADLDDLQSPADVPFGLLIDGDAAGIEAVIAKLERAAGVRLSDLSAAQKSSGDRVAVASSPEYADALLSGKGLADQAAFRDVVPEADRASGVAFVQLDGAWRKAIRDQAAAGSAEDKEFFANLDVVRAAGISSWQDGAVSHALARVTLR